MATNVIGIFGKTCSAKSDVAREISRMTGNKVKHPGEMITTRARMAGAATGKGTWRTSGIVPWTKTRSRWWMPCPISTSCGSSRAACSMRCWGRETKCSGLSSTPATTPREARWHKRKEEMGGRSRQIGESVTQRDADDAVLRERLYGAAPSGVAPVMTIDTSDKSPTECAVEILAAFQSETGVVLSVARAEMDKTATRGIVPGPSRGVIRSYTPQRPPFGGYITDETSGKGLYVHKSRGRGRRHPGPLKPGSVWTYDIVEDGFGGFKASELAVEE